jgi:hypothetical protein
MPDSSKGKAQTKCNRWSFGLGFGCGIKYLTPGKNYRYETMEEATIHTVAPVKKKKKFRSKLQVT